MVDIKYGSSNNFDENDFTTKETKESILLSRIAQGDIRAFWKIWTLYQDYLYHQSLIWMGGNHDDAQEIVSLASLKACHKLPHDAHKITNLKGWLNRFVHNLCIDIHRQRKYKAIGVNNVENVTVDGCEIASSDYPESKLLQKELYVYISYCINGLDSRLRDPLVLSYYQGMSYAEISKQLSISPANVAKRIQEAKQKLKQNLEEYFWGLNTTNISEDQSQQFDQQELSTSVSVDSNIEEINYGITISCLETLPPVWYQFQHPQD